MKARRVEKLIIQARELHQNIKTEQKAIDNPALVMGILSELEFFIENIGGEEE
ncbi:hypothetical protein [Sporosarcina sp. Marseille-Q4943]|uniref:hypothetical protein n=1 Tax=Sporosarcina sp. Marseille-Q4943 TaxID=2942204 RepID=UPI00208DD1B1|nr:hypothetical protein [Sporosarcina sp. Marseille-Q4943]